jgi:Phosphotransferase enzyme family
VNPTLAATPARHPAPPDDRTPARSPLERFLEALDPGRMGPRLAAAVGTRAACHVLDAKYEPGVSAIVLYECDGQLVRGDLVAGSETGPATVVAPGVRLGVFPQDPGIPTLPRVMDPTELGVALDTVLRPAASHRRWCRSTLLRYRPGKRATVLAALTGGGRYVAKAYHNPVKAATVAAEASALPTSGATRTLRFAPVLGQVPELALVVQGRVTGVPLDAVVGARRASTGEAPAAVRRAAQALVELHESRPASARQRSVEREVRRFGERAARIGTVDARLGDALGRLAERLRGSDAALPPMPHGSVHGDCKPSQFLLSGRHAYLLDLDHLGVSDQGGDVGTFLASLRQVAVRRSLARSTGDPFAELATLADQFLEAYVERRGRDADRARIRWHEAAALERKAIRAFARAPVSPLAGALCAQAERCLDALGVER